MSALDLSTVGLVDGSDVEKRAQSVYQLLEEVESQLRDDLGVSEMPDPKSQPTPLAELDVAVITNRELGGLHAQYVSYSVFLAGRLAKINGLERAARGNLKRVTAEIKNELRADGVKEAELSARVEVHPLYEQFYMEAMKLFMTKEIGEAYVKAYKEMASALSRNIALRELEFEQQRREDSIGKKKAGASASQVAGGRRRRFSGS